MWSVTTKHMRGMSTSATFRSAALRRRRCGGGESVGAPVRAVWTRTSAAGGMSRGTGRQRVAMPPWSAEGGDVDGAGLLEPGQGVEGGLPVGRVNLQVQVGTGGVAVAAHLGDDVPGADLLALADMDA